MIGRIFGTCALLVLVFTSHAGADQSKDEQAIRSLNNTFAEAFVKKDAKLRASVFAMDATLVTPQGVFLIGRPAMVNDFGPEAQAFVTPTTRAVFSCYRFRFLTSDIAFVDSLLTVYDVTGPDGKLIAKAPISVTQLAVRHGDSWSVQDERAHYPMTSLGSKACL